MKKQIVITFSIAALLFANIPTAHALSISDIKEFLIGPDSQEREVQSEQTFDQSHLAGAAALATLSSTDNVAILATAETVTTVQEESNTGTFVFSVESGDTLWGHIDADLEETFPQMSQQQRNYTIDRIVDEMRSLSEAEYEQIGLSSGNVDLIYPDEEINFSVTVSGDSASDIEVNLN